MSAAALATRALATAVIEAESAGVEPDALCRSLMGKIVERFLLTRSVADVQAELRFIADNCDPGTDHVFMRP